MTKKSTVAQQTIVAVKLVLQGVSVTDATKTITSTDATTEAVLGASLTLISQVVPHGGLVKDYLFSRAALIISSQAVFKNLDDGKFTVDDVVSTSAALGAYLAGIPHPTAKLAGGILSAYAIVAPLLANFGRSLGNTVYDHFNGAQNFQPRIDPLALDLNGDGIKTGTGWLKGGINSDGLLVWDKNNNGKIDNGSELFGIDFVKEIKADGTKVKAKHGFDALNSLDSNQDGIFDNKDNKFNQIKVWQDKNQDGVSQASELKTLAQHGITSIKLNSQANRVNLNNGNVQTDESVFNYVKKDGTTSTNKIANLALASNPFRRWFSHKIALSDEVKKLPFMQGSGMVRDLSEAMMLSPSLLNLVKQYTQAATYQSQRSLLNQLISAWAKTAPTSFKTSLDKAKDYGFKLVYMLPGQNKSHFNKGATLSSSEQALMTKQNKLVKIITLLEKFNG